MYQGCNRAHLHQNSCLGFATFSKLQHNKVSIIQKTSWISSGLVELDGGGGEEERRKREKREEMREKKRGGLCSSRSESERMDRMDLKRRLRVRK